MEKKTSSQYKIPLIKNDFSFSENIQVENVFSNSNSKDPIESLETENKSTPNNQNIELAKKYQLISTILLISCASLAKVVMYKWQGEYYVYYYIALRFIFISICCFINLTRENKTIASVINFGQNKKWHIIRIVAWLINNFGFCIALHYLKLGTISIILMISPILTNILSSYLFNDQHSKGYLYSCIICLIGAVIMMSNRTGEVAHDQGESKIYMVLGYLGSILNPIGWSFVVLASKPLQHEYDPINLNFLSSFWAGIVALIVSIFAIPDFSLFFNFGFVFCCSLIGLISYFGFFYMNLAVKTADISKTSYFIYLQIPLLSIFGMVFYGEVYGFIELIGALIILGTVFYSTTYLK